VPGGRGRTPLPSFVLETFFFTLTSCCFVFSIFRQPPQTKNHFRTVPSPSFPLVTNLFDFVLHRSEMSRGRITCLSPFLPLVPGQTILGWAVENALRFLSLSCPRVNSRSPASVFFFFFSPLHPSPFRNSLLPELCAWDPTPFSFDV